MLGTSVDTFRLDMRRYPKELDELLRKPSDDKNWDGPYVKKDLPTDPWERPYVYKCPGDEGRDYDIISYVLTGQLEATEKMPISIIGKALKKARNKSRPFGMSGGFSLVELMIVLAIMALVFGMAAPRIAKEMGVLHLRTTAKQVAASLRYDTLVEKLRFDASLLYCSPLWGGRGSPRGV